MPPTVFEQQAIRFPYGVIQLRNRRIEGCSVLVPGICDRCLAG